jgi:putative protease
MSSKDMNMIAHVPELMELGISSFKVEGRMKSAYYAAVCANTYRMAMDAYEKDPEGYTFDPLWERELESVTHREYCSGYWFDDPLTVAQTVTVPGYLTEKTYIATVVSYDPTTGLATLVQKNKCCVGDRVELLTPGKTGRAFVASEMYNSKNEPIESCPHPFMEFKLRVPFEAKEGDILRSDSDA